MIIGRCAVAARMAIVVGALGLSASALAGPGDILVGSRLGHSVLQFDASKTDFLGTFAVDPLVDPSDSTLGPDGDLYVTDLVAGAVYRYDGKTGAFKGPFVAPGAGGLTSPQSLVFGPNGNLFVTGTPNCTINEYDGKTGAFIRNVFNLGATIPGQITFGPKDGLIYYVCQTCRVVKLVDPVTGELLKIFIQNDQDGPVVARGIAWGPDGNCYLTSGGANDSIRVYDGTTGKFIKTFAQGGGLNEPYDVIFGSDNVMYVSGADSSNVAMFNSTSGVYLGQAATFGQGGLQKAGGLVELSVPDCYADFTGDGKLDIFDFLGYMNSFNAGQAAADCDEDGDRDLFDFLCYQNAFVGGCN